jgi:two-component system sensor histidine kinase/response regulator
MNFPFKSSGDGSDSAAFARRMKEGHFLVVDDFDSMRKVTINQLKQLGAIRIVEAANGAEAMKILSGQPVTMILSDWNMPVMSGFDLLLAVRSDPKLFSLPFLMITAEAERERVQQAIHAGVSQLLVKPYTAARLSDRIERSMSSRPRLTLPIDPAEAMSGPAAAARPTAVAPAPTAEARNRAAESMAAGSGERIQERPTILVVDDTPDNLNLLSHLFKEEYRVRIAHNGEKALSICQSDTPPDLVLLDVMMPGMDGFEVAASMRGHPSSEQIPVIFVTALTDETSRVKGMELGAVDFVTKPIDPDALRLKVRNFMRYVELHRQLQADYDEMLETAKLKEDVEHITRHDMKGPLAGVIGLIQGLADAANLTADQREQLRIAEETTLQALNMINLSAELYKIETGRFVLHAKPVPLAEIIRRLAEMSRKTFAVKELTLAVATPHGIRDDQLMATGDSMLCYSLFQNLIKNACEAAPDNTRVTITLYDETPLRVVLSNTGAVPGAIRTQFFDKFVTQGKDGGTGLGTYSAKMLTEAQHGTIGLEVSDADNRTTITVELPR